MVVTSVVAVIGIDRGVQSHIVQWRTTGFGREINIQILFLFVAGAILAILVGTAIDDLAPRSATVIIVIAAGLISIARAAFVAQLALVLAGGHASSIGTSLI